jgi:hypothetical protein
MRTGGNWQAKAEAVFLPCFRAQGTVEPFSLGRGLIHRQRFFKLSIFLSFSPGVVSENDEGDPLGRPRLELLCG